MVHAQIPCRGHMWVPWSRISPDCQTTIHGALDPAPSPPAAPSAPEIREAGVAPFGMGPFP